MFCGKEAIDPGKPDDREAWGGGTLTLTEVVKLVLQSHCYIHVVFSQCSRLFDYKCVHFYLDKVCAILEPKIKSTS